MEKKDEIKKQQKKEEEERPEKKLDYQPMAKLMNKPRPWGAKEIGRWQIKPSLSRLTTKQRMQKESHGKE